MTHFLWKKKRFFSVSLLISLFNDHPVTQNASLYVIMITSIAFSHKKQKIRVNVLREKINSIIDKTLTISQKFVKF